MNLWVVVGVFGWSIIVLVAIACGRAAARQPHATVIDLDSRRLRRTYAIADIIAVPPDVTST